MKKKMSQEGQIWRGILDTWSAEKKEKAAMTQFKPLDELRRVLRLDGFSLDDDGVESVMGRPKFVFHQSAVNSHNAEWHRDRFDDRVDRAMVEFGKRQSVQHIRPDDHVDNQGWQHVWLSPMVDDDFAETELGAHLLELRLDYLNNGSTLVYVTLKDPAHVDLPTRKVLRRPSIFIKPEK